MRNFKTRIIPESKRDELDKLICDICKKEAKYPNHDWAEQNLGHKTLKTEISLEDSNYFPDGGFGEVIKFDICPECFKNKLIPFIESFGAIPTFKEIDY